MPRYDFRCPNCGQVYEVSRPMSRATEPLPCPACKTECERVISMPMVFTKGGGSSEPSSPPSGSGYNHFGHSHGAGTGGHSHT